MLSENRIRELLAERGVSGELVFYDEVDSTNERAREYARSHRDNAAGEGKDTVIFLATSQSAGRGRRGRSFLSEEGGIYLSLLIYPREDVAVEKITAEAAVRAASAIEAVTGLDIGIKWVNDLYINGKKCAGILTEGEFDENGNLRYYVLGLGINVYKIDGFSDKMPIATTLEDEIKKKNNSHGDALDVPDINTIAKEIICALLSPEAPTLYDYRRRCIILDKKIIVKRGSDEFFATAKEILPDYSLLVELDEGKTFTLNSGEVTTVIS